MRDAPFHQPRGVKVGEVDEVERAQVVDPGVSGGRARAVHHPGQVVDAVAPAAVGGGGHD